MNFCDAHNHLQEPELAPHLPGIWEELASIGVRRAVVNGTREADWDRVRELAAAHPFLLPSFGLHPWYVKARSSQWLEKLTQFLDRHPGSGVGEIGLDRWIKGHDLAEQTPVFLAQLELAAERNLPASIHCIQAWGALHDVLRSSPRPARGFLLHAYGGPAEMVPAFVELGAYFSFSPYFLHERKSAQREAFRRIPVGRLLVETDAPALWPPPEFNRHPLQDLETGQMISHPVNLEVAYEALADLRKISLAELVDQVWENFQRWAEFARE